MSNSNMLFCSVFLFFSFASSSHFNTTLTTTPHHQCSALLHFKQNLSSFNFNVPWATYYCVDLSGTKSYYPIMMNWNTSTTDCCYWDGVTCNHSTSDVIGLDLSCGMLQGTLHPNTSLFDLPHLQTLNLAFNDFTGSQIPPQIGRFSNTLRDLNISVCEFSGQVPAEITLLHKLVSLDLSRNYLYLEPRVFINLLQNHTCLEKLSLGQSGVSSVLPAHLNISSSLKSLYLDNTGLHGNLPSYIFNLQYLENLDLSGNKFTGQIPSEISLLPKLVSLDLSWNYNLRIKPYIFKSLIQNSTLLEYLRFGDVNIGLVFPAYLNISSSMKSLDLRNTSLKGKLPDNIFNLQYLEVLDMSSNTNLIGPLPKVNNTIPLKRLSLSSTNLSLGKIPDSIGHFKSLTFLDLSYCNLTGPIPKSISNLRHLTTLDLSSNKLNGTLPSSMFSLQSLESLILDDNEFDGQIYVLTFQKLTKLVVLRLSWNKFSGYWELDTLLSSLTNLVTLGLSFSGLSITTSNANHHVNPNLRYYLYLASCKIKVFPESLRSMTNIQWLDLSSNEIHGQIPHWAGEIGGSELGYLDLSNNSIIGLPQFQWYGLLKLNLESNLIQGPFPPSICNMSSLSYLNLSNNSFDGVIPQCFGNITPSLAMINLGTNHFQGTISNVYENSRRLEGLILNGNQFEGEVPSSLTKCQSLKVLDMGNNLLNGTFPQWLESLPNLQVLVLKSNSFHGHIVPSAATVGLRFPNLQVIDLSHNRFEGQLPREYLQNFNAMKNRTVKRRTLEYLKVGNVYGDFYSFVGTVKGVVQVFRQLNVYYTIVCLSNNNFVGEIPDIIGNLNSLVVLDLSHNSLTGQIPHTIGKLSEIESLDLSCNQLTGKIPQSLVDLTFLGFLNLSQNHLLGLIPVGKQLNTFKENSFEGNPNLCGFPLPGKCNDNPQDPQTESDGDGDEEENGFTWKVVMLGYGCGILFGLVMGYLMLSTGRPMWFNVIVDEVEQVILKRKTREDMYI